MKKKILTYLIEVLGNFNLYIRKRIHSIKILQS